MTRFVRSWLCAAALGLTTLACGPAWADPVTDAEAAWRAVTAQGGSDTAEALGAEWDLALALTNAGRLAEAMSKVLGDPKSTAIVWKPQTEVAVSGEQVATLIKLLDALDAEDDVSSVYSNEDISDEEMAKFAG